VGVGALSALSPDAAQRDRGGRLVGGWGPPVWQAGGREGVVVLCSRLPKRSAPGSSDDRSPSVSLVPSGARTRQRTSAAPLERTLCYPRVSSGRDRGDDQSPRQDASDFGLAENEFRMFPRRAPVGHFRDAFTCSVSPHQFAVDHYFRLGGDLGAMAVCEDQRGGPCEPGPSPCDRASRFG